MADTDQLNLGLLLFIPYRHLESAVLAELAAHGHRLSLSQARVFQRIDSAGSRMSELAAASQLSKQTVTSIVDQLDRAGYVVRHPDPGDARARIVSLTDSGRELVELSLPVVAEVEDRWREHLGDAGAEQLRELLARLREITDPYLPADPAQATR